MESRYVGRYQIGELSEIAFKSIAVKYLTTSRSLKALCHAYNSPLNEKLKVKASLVNLWSQNPKR